MSLGPFLRARETFLEACKVKMMTILNRSLLLQLNIPFTLLN